MKLKLDEVRELMNTYLLDESLITPEMMIKTTHGILVNAGYEYGLEEVRKEYYA